MWRFRLLMILLASIAFVGCDADDDGDDVAGEPKTPIAMDKVPEAILKAAKKSAPDLTFYAAYNDTFNGQKSIELKGKTKTGKIKEIEVSLDGKVLGEE